MVFKDSSYQLSGKQNLALIKAQNKKNSFLSTKFTAGVCFFFFFFFAFFGGALCACLCITNVCDQT